MDTHFKNLYPEAHTNLEIPLYENEIKMMTIIFSTGITDSPILPAPLLNNPSFLTCVILF